MSDRNPYDTRTGYLKYGSVCSGILPILQRFVKTGEID